jgi:hypothetical protein
MTQEATTPLDNLLGLLRPAIEALVCSSQGIRREGADWIEGIIKLINKNQYPGGMDPEFILINANEAIEELAKYRFEHAASSIGRICTYLLEQASRAGRVCEPDEQVNRLNSKRFL